MKPIKPIGFSRLLVGAGIMLAAAAVQAQVQVTFQIDMAPLPGATDVEITGSWNGWNGPGAQTGSNILINTSGTIWSNTVTIYDPPGTVENCKFTSNPGGNWEADPNRQFVVPPSDAVLPLTSWNVKDWPVPTNHVTFQVNMSAQQVLGNFTNGDPNSTITVSGDFEGWDGGKVLTNNPTAGDITSNYYSGTFDAVGFPGGTTINYKFRMNGGWESPVSTGGGNRQAAINSVNQVLPLVYYNDNSVYDLVLSPITVQFSLYVTNGTTDDGTISPIVFPGTFIKGTTHLYINGNFFAVDGSVVGAGTGSWWTWEDGLGDGSQSAAVEMVEVGSSDLYTNSFVLPKGSSIYMAYKYSMAGFDDENGFSTNHTREIRTYGPVYTCPQDVWSWTVLQPGNGNPYPNPGLASTNITEPDFGNLAIQPASGGNFPITWLGRPGVVLQNSPDLPGGNWNINNGTDATMSTNWPAGGSAQFFRLYKKQ